MVTPGTDSAAPLRVLLVEDDEDDYVLIRDLLKEVPGPLIELEWANGYAQGSAALTRQEHAVCLMDYRLGRRTGLDLLAEAVGAGCKVPIILLTGQGERDIDLQAMGAGAADYLVKGQIDALLLERAIRYAIERRRHEESLRQLQAELEQRVRERTAELERANAALREADRRKDEFLATLAHELRNPLAPLVNGLQLLKLTEQGHATSTAREVMERQLNHLVRLVDDLLDVSRVTQGKIRLRREQLDLREVVRCALETSWPVTQTGRHQVKVRQPEDAVYVEGDLVRLTQILSNLLNNSSKYSPDGTVIELSIERERDKAVVRVRDQGLGIPAEMLPHVFDLFAQVDRHLERSQGGLGIGLSLVKSLAEMHGGTASAHSEGLGRGSEFVVRLPIVVATCEEKERPSALAERRTTALLRRVLVVDDNVDAADSLALVLQLTGYEVRVVHDGIAALAAAKEFLPDVVLLDIGLPRLNGYEVAERLRRESSLGKVLLVATSGYGQEEDRRRSREAGFDWHLVKPVDLASLQGILGSPSLCGGVVGPPV